MSTNTPQPDPKIEGPYQATSRAELRHRLMDSRIAKSEIEWFAKREIESLQQELAETKKELQSANHYLPELRMAEEALISANKDLNRLFLELPTMGLLPSPSAMQHVGYALDRIQALTHPKPSPHEQIT